VAGAYSDLKEKKESQSLVRVVAIESASRVGKALFFVGQFYCWSLKLDNNQIRQQLALVSEGGLYRLEDSIRTVDSIVTFLVTLFH